ncbi:MAG: GWxTD domain-containing protein [Ignavibacteria bacterium]|nr:GWxTD domain-containing protein [Ignavibacteria bacterium]
MASREEISKIKKVQNSGAERENTSLNSGETMIRHLIQTKMRTLVDYYKRIGTANERYSHCIDGWKTDMGMVLLYSVNQIT